MIDRYSEDMTFENILASMLKRVPDTVDKREGSVIYDALAPAAAELAKMYIGFDVIMDETFVDTASLQYLILRCKERGVPIKDASAAVIEGSFTPVTLELEAGLRFNCEDQNYVITEKIEDGKYKLECESPGTDGNLYSGFLFPIQYINGLQTAEITGVLIPGEEADDADTLRKRYYDSIKGLAFGGNIADYKQKVNLIDGVGGVKVYPCWNGGGTVKLAIIDSEFRPPAEALIDKVQTEIDPEMNHGKGLGLAPIGHTVTVTGVLPAAVDINTELTFKGDWTWDRAQFQAEEAINKYFDELAESWADEERIVIRVSQIETRLLALDCVLDIADTRINGEAKNLQLSEDEIPVLNEIGGLW